ncbi:histidine phosphatase family protein [Variovorax sp. ZT4R33]|uniref:histidine phosphatase family protein n=1 Tax=Variovorax sp. ZT4R33 TaxID=3443743 RepID=UPI003F482DF5
MQRRRMAGLALLPLFGAAAQAADLAETLRRGRCALLLRHAGTTAGIGDPPGFTLERCNTQRNLSEEGRAQAQRIGAWFDAKRLKPAAVRTSAWCRCRDTAQLAFAQALHWAPLDSTFENRSLTPAATQALRSALAALPAGRFEVWVTHQVNITALTGEFVQMGEGLVVDAAGALQGRSRFD